MGRNTDNNVKDNVLPERNNFNVNAFTGTLERYEKAHKQAKAKSSGSAQAKIRRAQRIADELVRKFGPQSKSCYRYFCKCAYNLPENVIWECYESSCRFKVTNKLAYFLASTKAQPQMA